MRKTTLGVTVKSASQQIGIPEPAVRVLMRREKLPIGIAEKISGTRYTYYITQELIDRYLGKELVQAPADKPARQAEEEGQAQCMTY